MVVLISFAAIAVDVGSIHHDSRRLQGATDLAALAAANNTAKASDAARTSFTDNGGWQLDSMTVDIGNYDPNPATPPDQRFVADRQPINAARVTASAPSPVQFSRIFGADDVEIAASAIATHPAEAAFSIGSRLLSLNGGVINAVLSQMLGSEVSLEVMDYRALADADIDLLKFLDQLAVEADVKAGTYQQVLDADVTAGNILTAMGSTARAENNVDAADVLKGLASAVSGSTLVDLSRLLDIGKVATAEIGTSPQYGLAAGVNALQMLNALALVSNDDHQVDVDLGATVPGLTKTQLSLAIGEPPQGTSWITVGEQGAFVRTAQTRLKIVAEVGGSGLLAGVTLRVPVFVDVAYAQGELSKITCGLTADDNEVTISTQPGILNAWIGDVSNFTAINDTPSVTRANIVNVAGLARISGSAHVEVGNATARDLVFSASDISNRVYKTAVTQTYSQSLVSSLVGNLDLRVDALSLPDPFNLVKGQLKALVRTLVAPTTTTLDQIAYTALTTLGIKLGEADVTVHGVRCKNAVVVQ
jgi:uncharacterized membrane protein